MGEESSLILYADGAEVEARTHENCLAVASSPCSPRASPFHKVRSYDKKHSRLQRYQARLLYLSYAPPLSNIGLVDEDIIWVSMEASPGHFIWAVSPPASLAIKS